jgi:hypothetical protein
MERPAAREVVIREMGAESDFTSAIKPIEKAAGVVVVGEPALTPPSRGRVPGCCVAPSPGALHRVRDTKSSQPRRRLVQRDQRIDLDAGPHHRVLIGLDQNFRHQRAGVVA